MELQITHTRHPKSVVDGRMDRRVNRRSGPITRPAFTKAKQVKRSSDEQSGLGPRPDCSFEDLLPSGSILFAIKASKLYKQTTEQTSKFVSGGLRVERNSILCQSCDKHVYGVTRSQKVRVLWTDFILEIMLIWHDLTFPLKIRKRYKVESKNAFKSDRSNKWILQI